MFVLGAIVISFLEFSEYGVSEDDFEIENKFGDQAGLQLAALGVTLLFAIASGALTGFILKLKIFNQSDDIFIDEPYWVDAKAPESVQSRQ